ncbi:CxxxxCH/CxxCH domain-containing protein [Aeromonas caviae]
MPDGCSIRCHGAGAGPRLRWPPAGRHPPWGQSSALPAGCDRAP